MEHPERDVPTFRTNDVVIGDLKNNITYKSFLMQ